MGSVRTYLVPMGCIRYQMGYISFMAHSNFPSISAAPLSEKEACGIQFLASPVAKVTSRRTRPYVRASMGVIGTDGSAVTAVSIPKAPGVPRWLRSEAVTRPARCVQGRA